MFRSKQRTAAAWAKGLMLGKAVGARDERDRIIKFIEDEYEFVLETIGAEPEGLLELDILKELLERLPKGSND